MPDRLRKLYYKYEEAILYLFFGGLTTVVNYVTYLLFARFLTVGTATVPTAIAWIVSVIFAYVTNRIWVFRSEARGAAFLGEAAAFVGARAFSLLPDIAIMWLAVDYLSCNDLIIKLLSNVLVVIINYFLSKFWIFRRKNKAE